MICNGCDTSTLPNPQDDRLPWLNVLRNHPRYWKTLVRRATIHARLQSRNRFHVISAHQRLQPSLSSAGVTFDSGAVEEDGPATFGCMCCGMAFRSKAGEKAHMRGRHGELDKVRYQRDFFNSGPGVQRHLHNVPLRRHQLESRRAFVTPAPGIGSITVREQQQAHARLAPTLQAEGPHLPDVPPFVLDTHHGALHHGLCQFLLEHFQPLDPLQRVAELQRVIVQYDVSWTHLVYTMEVHGVPHGAVQ